MQPTLNLTFTPASPTNKIFKNTTWLDAGWATACLGFTKKVEISQALSDCLQPLQMQDADDADQHLYGALWLAHHYLALDQRRSFSFTFDFLRDDKYLGKFTETSLRLHLQEKEHVILLGLPQDF
ncbi:MAG TPA: hypothetical protein VJ972_15005 [Anaerolineales bacterium]|nr:hypothetical protein [Anaerolineales bacterium]